MQSHRWPLCANVFEVNLSISFHIIDAVVVADGPEDDVDISDVSF